MLCISRITDDVYSQKFGNGHHKFYIELRCNNTTTSDICSKCTDKTGRIQHSRKFNHGTIHDPIPDISHIYGGKWYHDSVKKYGTPTKESIEFAEKYQRDARKDLPIMHLTLPTPLANPLPTSLPTLLANPLPIKPKRSKPIIEKTPYSVVNSVANKLVHIDISSPTHLETKIEEIDGCQIEYIKLTPFDHDGTSYFKDSKNKLYKKIKDKIGPYVGKFENNSIMNVPDSDDESTLD